MQSIKNWVRVFDFINKHCRWVLLLIAPLVARKPTFTTAKCQNNLYAEELILSFTQCLRLHPIFRRSPNCDLFNSTDHRVLDMWQSVRS